VVQDSGVERVTEREQMTLRSGMAALMLLAAVACSGTPAGAPPLPVAGSTRSLPTATGAARGLETPSVSSTPAADRWSGTVDARGFTVHLHVPQTDAIRFQVDGSGADLDAFLITPSGTVLRSDAPQVLYSVAGPERVFYLEGPSVGEWSLVLRSPVQPQSVTASAIPVDIPVNPNAQLQVSWTAPSTVHVTAEGSSDPDGHVVHYTWSFGDGTYVDGSAARHTYTTEGTYVIALEVEDKPGPQRLRLLGCPCGAYLTPEWHP
jgi:PKD domain-containing protein